MEGKLFTKATRALLAGGATCALVLGMSPLAMAATQVDEVNAVSKDTSAKIGKTLKMAKDGVTNPNFTFQFDYEPVAATELYGITQTAKAKNPTTIDMSNKTSDEGEAVFKASEFSKAGVYGYWVTENATAKAGDVDFKGDANHVLTMDSTKYLVRIKVVNNKGTLAIAGISAQPVTEETKNNDGSTTYEFGNKIDGSTDGTKGLIPFINKYTEYGNDDPDDPNNPADVNKGLVISKSVTGQGAQPGEKFIYSIKFTKDDVNTDTAGDPLVTSVSKAKDAGTTVDTLYSVAPAKGGDGNYTGGTKAESISYGTPYYFVLGNTDSIAFKVPAGTSYKVTETNGDYTVSTSTVTNGATAKEGTEATVSSYVGEKSNTVAYTNDKGASPLTGVVNQYGGLIAVVAIAAGGLVVLGIRRRRENA